MTACPDTSLLSAWLDGELEASRARAVQEHVEDCEHCRAQLDEWVNVFELTATDTPAPLGPPGACLDDAALISYGENEMHGGELKAAEEHLLTCTRCVGEVQRLLHLKFSVEAITEPRHLSPPHEPFLARLWNRVTQTLRQPMLGAALTTAVAVVLIVLIRSWSVEQGISDVQYRGRQASRTVTIMSADVVARAYPRAGESIVATLPVGTTATYLEAEGEWIRIQLADGKRAWVPMSVVSIASDAAP